MDVDDHILALLSESPKHFTELADAIVKERKVCARGTLDKHLKDLRKQKKIKRELLENRTTKYSLMPESFNRARSARDVISLESLISELEYKTTKELELKEIPPETVFGELPGLSRMFLFKNMPDLNFRLLLDRDTLKLIELTQSTSDLSSRLENFIHRNLHEVKQKLPSTIKEEIPIPSSWNGIKEYSRKLALKHGMRFLVVSWYDGKEYKQRIMSSMKSMERLESGHQGDIDFLNEVDQRCLHSSREFYNQLQLNERIESLLKMSDPHQSLEDAFLLYFADEKELMWLEIALISGSDLLNEIPFSGELESFHGWNESDYHLISLESYVKMKLPFLSEDEKVEVIKKYLNLAKEETSRGYSEDYNLSISYLLEKLDTGRSREAQIDIQSPIMNFRLHDERREIEIDFSEEPFTRNFIKFKNDLQKRKWLQKCLLLGLPVFPNIPFEKLGFEVKTIL